MFLQSENKYNFKSQEIKIKLIGEIITNSADEDEESVPESQKDSVSTRYHERCLPDPQHKHVQNQRKKEATTTKDGEANIG